MLGRCGNRRHCLNVGCAQYGNLTERWRSADGRGLRNSAACNGSAVAVLWTRRWAYCRTRRLGCSAVVADAGRSNGRSPLVTAQPRLHRYPAGRSYTGLDTIEITLPGAQTLVDYAIDQLCVAGAQLAEPGQFTRMAVASGRLDVAAAEAVMALVHASDAAAAARALTRLRGGLSRSELGPVRDRLIALRAAVEAGLDFLDEDDVSSYDPASLQAELTELTAGVVARWQRAAGGDHRRPVVALVGPANAGKSALFAHLTGHNALVSDVAGTTRDHLEGVGHRLATRSPWSIPPGGSMQWLMIWMRLP